jgi:hypothetical protein
MNQHEHETLGSRPGDTETADGRLKGPMKLVRLKGAGTLGSTAFGPTDDKGTLSGQPMTLTVSKSARKSMLSMGYGKA